MCLLISSSSSGGVIVDQDERKIKRQEEAFEGRSETYIQYMQRGVSRWMRCFTVPFIELSGYLSVYDLHVYGNVCARWLCGEIIVLSLIDVI